MPAKHHALDAALLLLLGTIAFLGFDDTYASWTYLIAGVAGLALGIAIAFVGRGQPVVVLGVGLLAAFFVLGGAVALHGLGGLAVLPVPDTLGTLADNSVNGWKRLLTTLPPVDGGALLTIPYILGLVSGCVGFALAIRSKAALPPVLVALLLMAGVILLGVQDPSKTALLGSLFGAIAIAWLCIRGLRARSMAGGGRRISRTALGAGLCIGAAGLAFIVGPFLPGLAPERTVLRGEIEPPFNVGKYPSPLAGYRVYTKGYQTPEDERRLYEKDLFSVSGLPEGTRVRVAAMDSYDGTVWRAANDSGVSDGADDTFQKISSTLRNPLADGKQVRGTITIGEDFGGVWVPLPTALTHISFDGPDSDSFRYNLATSTGVLPSALKPGDSYSFTASVSDEKVGEKSETWSGGSPIGDEAAQFQALAAEYAGGGESPITNALAVASKLKEEGTYTDGEPPNQQYPAGHSLRRLADFTAKGGQLAGNDEQYAALMAVLANQVGVPARVVLGAVVGSDGVVQGKDMHAWVELRMSDGSWATLDWSEFMNTEKPPEQNAPQPEELVTGKVVPPPAPVRPPSTSGDPLDESVNQKANSRPDGFTLPGWLVAVLKYVGLPLLLIAALCGAIIGAKLWRRHLRRTRGTPVNRLSGGWRETLDHARDHGVGAPVGATRREQAAVLAAAPGLDGAPGLALMTDTTMFAEASPEDDAVAAYWDQVGTLRTSLSSERTRWQRIRASINPLSLVPARLLGKREASRPGRSL
ncbi:MAG: DUF3488 and transglutaminase-like domain-containing protein [Nocardioides sp.]|uniref:DUF3488 and transglutaminase-like domain-containing protein n=1 Tax=Nocardioides sp. TaxID=35761 RepID=UPI003D6ACE57